MSNQSAQKIKKDQSGKPPVIKLAENPDILQQVAKGESAPFCVGFAAESENVLDNARAKRKRKGIPLLVANDVSQAMGKATNQITLLDDERETELPEMSKDDAAERIVLRMAGLMLRDRVK